MPTTILCILTLEELRLKHILGCKLKGFPKNMTDDKGMKRGDFDYLTSNTDLRVIKRTDNLHLTFTVCRTTQKDGSLIEMCLTLVADYINI